MCGAMTTMDPAEVLWAGDLEIRPAEHLARARGRTLSLSVRELQLLAALARREGRIVPREELYETVWGAPLRLRMLAKALTSPSITCLRKSLMLRK